MIDFSIFFYFILEIIYTWLKIESYHFAKSDSTSFLSNQFIKKLIMYAI